MKYTRRGQAQGRSLDKAPRIMIHVELVGDGSAYGKAMIDRYPLHSDLLEAIAC